MRAGTGDTALAFLRSWQKTTGEPSRFSSEIGTKTDAKRQPWGVSALERLVSRHAREAPKGFCGCGT